MSDTENDFDYMEEYDEGDMDLYNSLEEQDIQEEYEQKFENEIGFIERSAFASDYIVDENEDKRIKNPSENLFIRVDAISRNLNENDILHLNQNDINFMRDYIKNIKSPEYINSTGYILGYYVTNGGIKINTENLNKIFKLLKNNKIQSGGIKEPDVIRYARYWINLRSE